MTADIEFDKNDDLTKGLLTIFKVKDGKWEVVSKNSRKSTMWIDQKIHFPIKAQNADGTVTEFSNIKEGAQDAALFKVPSGYKPFDPAALGGQRRPK